MGDSIVIITSKNVSRDDLDQVVLAFDGAEDPYGNWDLGDISVPGHCMVSLDAGEDAGNLRIIKIDHPERLSMIREKIGGVPQTSINIEIDSEANSGKLAMRFFEMCADQWPCVVYSSSGEDFDILTKEEIQAIKSEGKAWFW